MPGIHQEIQFSANPARVYEALTQATAFSAFSGAPAEIGAREGDAFSLFGGMVTGRHLELVPAQRVVQSWRAGNWAPGIHSVVRFELAAAGTGTRLTFDHAGFPPEMQAHLEDGWQQMYWSKITQWLAH